MAAPQPKFKDTFRVWTENYGAFIGLVRQNLIKGYCTDRRPKIDQPVLPPEQKVPTLWFHIVLQTKTSSLTLAVRIDNLYLVGFKTPAGVWWEFGKNGDTHLLGGSARWLGFGGMYPDLIGHQKGLEIVTLGRAQMTAAVDVLANHGAAKAPEGAQDDSFALPKSKLVKLVIMICEGLRFNTVYGTVAKDFDNVEAKITKLDGQQVNEWNKISKAVLTWADDPKAKFPELEKVGVKDRNDAARIVALVKDKNAS